MAEVLHRKPIPKYKTCHTGGGVLVQPRRPSSPAKRPQAFPRPPSFLCHVKKRAFGSSLSIIKRSCQHSSPGSGATRPLEIIFYCALSCPKIPAMQSLPKIFFCLFDEKGPRCHQCHGDDKPIKAAGLPESGAA